MSASSSYHSILRILSAVVAVMLVFEGGLLSPVTARLADQTENYLANAVGVSVGVAPTELNQMTAALTARQKELDEREMAIAEREIEIGLNTDTTTRDSGTFVLATILFILLTLIILNYALDYARYKERIRLNKQNVPA